MKEKGYTLIELLGVIIILAVLITLIFPSLINSIKSSSNTKDSLTIDLIMNAAELFVDDNSKSFANINGNKYCIELNTLIENNYLKGDLEYEGESLIGVKDLQLTYNDGFNFELVDSEECNNYVISPPDLYNNTLTPVKYDGNNWIVANVTEKWYDYSKQEWANAVILNSSVNKKAGDVVTVDGENPDALAMFVWIPRYEYKIEGTYGTHTDGTLGTKDLPGEIEVNFISKDIKEATSSYIIHPAFNFGGEDISGIWVGKFELSHATKTTSLGCTTETCEESDNLRILPNIKSLIHNNVSSFFFAIRSMGKDKNVFGINSNITDSHMMKNGEWGAVVYLTQSRYGKYGNSDYEGPDKEVYINNSFSHYTGRSGGSYSGNTAVKTIKEYNRPEEKTQFNTYGYYTYDGYLLEYNTKNKTETRNMNKVASTTGNIYGIYDMSGGVYEDVMAVFVNSDGEKWAHSSGFSGKKELEGTNVEGMEWPNEKYYDVYKASNGTTIDSTTACNGGICYGHALNETSGWYSDDFVFVSASYPWILRGGNYDSDNYAGVFTSSGHVGAYIGGAARVVLTPTT